MPSVPSVALLLPLSAFTATGFRTKSRRVDRVRGLQVDSKKGKFDPTCLADSENPDFTVCPYLTDSKIDGVVSLDTWDNYTVTLSLASLTVSEVDPAVSWKVQSRLWLLRQAMNPALAFGADQATQFIKGLQDQLLDYVAQALENITGLPVVGDIVDAAIQTLNETKTDVVAQFSPPQTALDRTPNMAKPGFCSTRDVEVEMSGFPSFLVRNAEDTPIARTHNFANGCEDVWTLECHEKKLVKTTYCPMAEPKVDTQCIGAELACWFPTRTISAPRNGTIAFRQVGAQGWSEDMASGRMILKPVKRTSNTKPIMDGNEVFEGNLGPSKPMHSLALTFPAFVPKFAANLCAPLPEGVLRQSCELTVTTTLRFWEFIGDVANLNLIVMFKNDALVAAFPLDFATIGTQISAAIKEQMGGLIPGFTLEDALVKLDGVESRMLLSLQLLLAGNVYK